MSFSDIKAVLCQCGFQIVPSLETPKFVVVPRGMRVEDTIAQGLKVVDIEYQVEIIAVTENTVDVDLPGLFG